MSAAKGTLMTGTYLDKIVARKIEEVELLTHDEWEDIYGFYRTEPMRDFIGSLRRDTVALVAEVKHASPSKGVLIEPFDPVALATTYANNGAAAISVLTDRDFFQGKLADLDAVRKTVQT